MWVVYGFLMFGFSVFYYLLLRFLQKRNVDSKINTLMLFLPALPMFAIWIIISGKSVLIPWQYILMIFVATYLFSYLGNIYSVKGIKLAPNSGYSLIIQKSYAIFTAVASVFLFGSEISLKTILAIALIIAFSALIIIEKKQNNSKVSLEWIIPSFLAFFLFGGLALFSKYLLIQGIDPIVRSLYVQFFVSIMFGIVLFRDRKAVDFKPFLSSKLIIISAILMGIGNGLFNAYMQLGFDTAPNIGYINIMNTASITVITLLSSYFFHEKLTWQKMIGIIGVSIGLGILVI